MEITSEKETQIIQKVLGDMYGRDNGSILISTKKLRLIIQETVRSISLKIES